MFSSYQREATFHADMTLGIHERIDDLHSRARRLAPRVEDSAADSGCTDTRPDDDHPRSQKAWDMVAEALGWNAVSDQPDMLLLAEAFHLNRTPFYVGFEPKRGYRPALVDESGVFAFGLWIPEGNAEDGQAPVWVQTCQHDGCALTGKHSHGQAAGRYFPADPELTVTEEGPAYTTTPAGMSQPQIIRAPLPADPEPADHRCTVCHRSAHRLGMGDGWSIHGHAYEHDAAKCGACKAVSAIARVDDRAAGYAAGTAGAEANVPLPAGGTHTLAWLHGYHSASHDYADGAEAGRTDYALGETRLSLPDLSAWVLGYRNAQTASNFATKDASLRLMFGDRVRNTRTGDEGTVRATSDKRAAVRYDGHGAVVATALSDLHRITSRSVTETGIQPASEVKNDLGLLTQSEIDDPAFQRARWYGTGRLDQAQGTGSAPSGQAEAFARLYAQRSARLDRGEVSYLPALEPAWKRYTRCGRLF